MATTFDCSAPHKFSGTKDFNAPSVDISYSIELADDDLGKELLSFLKKNGEKRLKKVVVKQVDAIQAAIDETQVVADGLRAASKKQSKGGPRESHTGVVTASAERLQKMLEATPQLLKQGVKVLSDQVAAECESIKKDALGAVSKERKAAAKKLKVKGSGKAVLKGGFYATAGLMSLAATIATGGTGLGLAFGVMSAATSTINARAAFLNAVNSNLKSEHKVVAQIEAAFDEMASLSKKLRKLTGELKTHQRVRTAEVRESESEIATLTSQANSVPAEHADIKKAILEGAQPMKATCADLKNQAKITGDLIATCESVTRFNDEVGNQVSAVKAAKAATWDAATKVVGVGKSINIVISKLDNFTANFSSAAKQLKKVEQLGKVLSKLK